MLTRSKAKQMRAKFLLKNLLVLEFGVFKLKPEFRKKEISKKIAKKILLASEKPCKSQYPCCCKAGSKYVVCVKSKKGTKRRICKRWFCSTIRSIFIQISLTY